MSDDGLTRIRRRTTRAEPMHPSLLARDLRTSKADVRRLLDEVDRLRSGIALHRQTGMIARGPKDVPRYVRDLWALIGDDDE